MLHKNGKNSKAEHASYAIERCFCLATIIKKEDIIFIEILSKEHQNVSFRRKSPQAIIKIGNRQPRHSRRWLTAISLLWSSDKSWAWLLLTHFLFIIFNFSFYSFLFTIFSSSCFFLLKNHLFCLCRIHMSPNEH